jgi:hypothetical protein
MPSVLLTLDDDTRSRETMGVLRLKPDDEALVADLLT